MTEISNRKPKPVSRSAVAAPCCGGCHYWNRAAAREHKGTMIAPCRRFPPVVPPGYPFLLATGWCGEWKALI